jgi:thiamine-phosphate pyrophosphorylase
VRTLADARLYAIIDLNYVSAAQSSDILQKLIDGGIDLVQLRGKNRSIDELSRVAEKLLKQTTAASIPLIVNDHAEIAKRVGVQAVHVGQEDDAITKVRSAVNRPILVGKSTHSVAQAVAAEGEGADYIGFGPLFATPTKPDYPPIGLDEIREVHRQVKIPIFCIGGIKVANLPQVIAAGARRVVIVSALLQSDDPLKYAHHAKHLLGQVRDPRSEIRNS